MMVSEERGEAENKRLCSINSKIKLQNGGAPGPTKSAGTHGPCRVASQHGCGLQRFGYLWTPRDRRDCCKPGFVMSGVERPPLRSTAVDKEAPWPLQAVESKEWSTLGSIESATGRDDKGDFRRQQDLAN